MSVRRALDKSFDLGVNVGAAGAWTIYCAVGTYGAAMAGEPWWALAGFLFTIGNAWYGWSKYRAHRAGLKDLPEDPDSDVF